MIIIILKLIFCHKKEAMPKSVVTLKRNQFINREPLFLKDPNSDLLIILNQKIYPLHKKFLTQIGYFANIDLTDQKVHMINSQLDAKWFELVVGYFYGKQLQFLRNWEVSKALSVINYLSATDLMKKIIADIKNNFDQYGFFLLVSIAQKYKVKWLKQQCQQQLILMGFQQLNYNRYDLFQVDRSTFEQIIKLHQLLKVNQNIVGLRSTDLKRIISEYCKQNNISPEQFDKFVHSCQKTQMQNQPIINRKRNASSPNNPHLQQGQTQQVKNNSCQIIVKASNSDETDQNQQVYKLKIINSQIQQKNSKLIQEIQNVKHDLKKSSQTEEKAFSLQGIDEQFKRFQKLRQQQDAKYLSLKAQMQKLNPSGKNQTETLQGSSNSTKQTQNRSNRQRKLSENFTKKEVMYEMPKLSRDLDP